MDSGEYSFRQFMDDAVDCASAAVAESRTKKAESTTVSPKYTANRMLQRLPTLWISQMCRVSGLKRQSRKPKNVRTILDAIVPKESLSLLVSQMPEEQKAALRLVLKNGGHIDYGELRRKMGGDDAGLYKNGRPLRHPSSPVGILRNRGLLIVGNMHFGEETRKVAVIPADVARNIGCKASPCLHDHDVFVAVHT